MVKRETSVVRQRRLRTELRRIREESGRTQKAVAEALGWSTSKVVRIETGAVAVSTSDVMALLHYYEIKDPDVAEDLVAASRARDENWWDEFRSSYNQQFVNFLGYEDSATRIQQYMGLMVPGLLQTEEYARAVFIDYHPDREWVDRSVRIRMRRQELFDRPNCPEVVFILDEAVVHRWIGGPEVMQRQLHRLKDASRHPRISLRFVPFTVGMYAGMQGSSFTIFELPSSDPVVIVEDPHRDMNLDVQETGNYIETFLLLQQIACPEGGEVEKIIGSVIDKMRLDAKV